VRWQFERLPDFVSRGPSDPEVPGAVAAFDAQRSRREVLLAKIGDKASFNQPLIEASHCSEIRDDNLVRPGFSEGSARAHSPPRMRVT